MSDLPTSRHAIALLSESGAKHNTAASEAIKTRSGAER
jgi:hypothetical protein